MNLPDEKREAVAEAARDALDRCTCTPYPAGDGPEIDCPMHGRADFQGLAVADALAPLLAGWLAEARTEALDIAAALLGRVVDYWDGRPTQHHGHHIEADLRDVLRAIERDRDHNRAALAADTAETTGGGA